MRLFVEVIFWTQIFGVVINFLLLLAATESNKIAKATASILLDASVAIWAGLLLWL